MRYISECTAYSHRFHNIQLVWFTFKELPAKSSVGHIIYIYTDQPCPKMHLAQQLAHGHVGSHCHTAYIRHCSRWVTGSTGHTQVLNIKTTPMQPFRTEIRFWSLLLESYIRTSSLGLNGWNLCAPGDRWTDPDRPCAPHAAPALTACVRFNVGRVRECQTRQGHHLQSVNSTFPSTTAPFSCAPTRFKKNQYLRQFVAATYHATWQSSGITHSSSTAVEKSPQGPFASRHALWMRHGITSMGWHIANYHEQNWLQSGS